ncbi:MAG: hypothetical protein WCF92_03885 [bacterium]
MRYFLLSNQDTEDIFIAIANLDLIISKLLTIRELSTEFPEEQEVKLNMKTKIKNKERREKFLRDQKKALEQDYENIIF